MPLPVYRKNDSDKQINDNYAAFADSCEVVNTITGKQLFVGSPTGAGDNRVVSKAGVVKYWADRLDVFGDKVGKKRSADNNPIGAGNQG